MTISPRDVARRVLQRGRLIRQALTSPVVPNQSYSQCGEDLILRFAFQSLGTWRPSYLDIGAHDPVRLSNSALFYQIGARGVNVEPNPVLFREFERRRTRDVNLNVGVASESGTLDFFVMENPELSTFSRATVSEYEAKGERLLGVERVAVVPINEIHERYAPERASRGFDLISIDVEGMESDILRTLDFDRWAPTAFCVETVAFDTDETREDDISGILLPRGYFVYADTHINTIYFQKARWRELRARMQRSSPKAAGSVW